MLRDGYPPEEFDSLTLRLSVKRMKELRKVASDESNKDYIEANIWTILIKKCIKAADVGDFSGQCTFSLTTLINKQMNAKDVVDDLNKKWITIFKEFEDMVDARNAEITQKHKDEIREFEEKGKGKFKHYSPQYYELRQKEKALVRTLDFENAEKVKNQADEIAKFEKEGLSQKTSGDIMKKKQQIISKHQKETDKFYRWVNDQRHDLLRQRDLDMSGDIMRLSRYTKQLEKIGKKGIAPNPLRSQYITRVSRKDSMKPVRNVASTPVERDASHKHKREEIPHHLRTVKIRKSKK